MLAGSSLRFRYALHLVQGRSCRPPVLYLPRGLKTQSLPSQRRFEQFRGTWPESANFIPSFNLFAQESLRHFIPRYSQLSQAGMDESLLSE